MKHRRLSLTLIAALALTASACGRSQPAQTPSPTPVSTASPTPAMDPSRAALYAEADRVYRAYRKVQESFELTGNYDEFPPRMADYLDPEYLQIAQLVFERGKQEGWQVIGEPGEILTAPELSVSKGNSVVTLRTCSDSRGVELLNGEGEQIATGELTGGFYFFRYHDGALKIFDAELWEESQCPMG